MWHLDGPEIFLLAMVVLGPGVLPWFMGTMAGILVKTPRFGTVFAVSFTGGLVSWGITAGWVALFELVVPGYWGNSDVMPAGVVLLPLASGILLAVWAVRYSRRAQHLDALIAGADD